MQLIANTIRYDIEIRVLQIGQNYHLFANDTKTLKNQLKNF
jgi:hypothetical protein